MTLNEFQNKAMATCMPSCDNISYMMMNLVGEIGELASKIAKDIRKTNVAIGQGVDNDLVPLMPFDEWIERQEEYKKELGDILWQTAGVARVFGWEMEDVGQGVLDKLASRALRGKIDGEGDNR